MRILLFISMFLLTAASARAEEQAAAVQPHWSLEIKGGLFYPAPEDWKATYGRDRTSRYDVTLAYKLFRQMEAGIGAGYLMDRGKGPAPLNVQTGTTAPSVKYEAAPVNAFVLLRGVFNEHQWLVPYAGGGFTRMLYREKVEGQGAIRGHVDGYHGRAGIQLLLDNIDTSAATGLFLDYGVLHSYLFVEVDVIKATIDSSAVDLGGKSYLAGFLFEF